MKAIYSKLAMVFFGLLLCVQAKAQLLYEVSKDGKKSYLFGTYHLVGSSYVQAHPSLKQAFESSERVVVETILDSTAMLTTMQYAIMSQSLPDLVDSSEYALIKAKIEPLMQTPISMLHHMKPMLLSLTYAMSLAGDALNSEAAYTGTPLDQYFAEYGDSTGKEVIPLETVAEQAKLLFNSTTPKEQARELVAMLQEEEKAEDVTEDLVKAYLSQNLIHMEQLNEGYAANYGGMEQLIDQRNLNWMPELKSIYDGGNAFVAVGALHLVGEKGLIKLLRESGYTVRGIQF